MNDLFKSATPSHADRLLLSKSHCGTEGGKPKVCCPSSVDFEDRAGVPNSARLLPAINECVSVVQDRIYGGYNTKITDYPFMALVKYSKGNF